MVLETLASLLAAQDSVEGPMVPVQHLVPGRGLGLQAEKPELIPQLYSLLQIQEDRIPGLKSLPAVSSLVILGRSLNETLSLSFHISKMGRNDLYFVKQGY